MNACANRSIYVKSPWQFELRDNPVAEPPPGQLLVEISACGICGTDIHIADRMAPDWQVLGHEVAGIVRVAGAGVTRFKRGDRVALDSSAPCGQCEICQPRPYGWGRPHLCRSPRTYYGAPAMGFGQMLLTPQECAVAVPDSVPLDAASLVEPLSVSWDLVETARVSPGDYVLVIGPGPLGLGAVALAKRAGAGRVFLAGFSSSAARLLAGQALGADVIIEVDKRPLARHDFGQRHPDKILVTAPPAVLPEAISVAAYGGIVAYIGMAFGRETKLQIEADIFHVNKLSLRASYAVPAVHAAESIRLLEAMPELGKELISHRFGLAETGAAFELLRRDKRLVKKMVMTASH